MAMAHSKHDGTACECTSTTPMRRRARRSGLVATLTLAVLALAAFALVPKATAHSTRLAPHKRIHVPQAVSYSLIRKRAQQQHQPPPLSLGGSFRLASKRSTLPAPFAVLDGQLEQPLHDDTVLVRFEVPSDDDGAASFERVSMLLGPTEDLVHPNNAKIVYLNTDPLTGETYQVTEPLARQDVLAYAGHVLHEHQVEARLQEAKIGLRHSSDEEERSSRGWARLVLSRDALHQRTLAEGAFTLDGELHHLKSVDSWAASRHEDEPALHARHYQANEGMVLLRDRDLSTGAFSPDAHAQLQARSAPTTNTPHASCNHDSLEFNADFEHPIYKTGRQQAFNAMYGRKPSWLDGLIGSSSADMSSSNVAGLVRRQTGGGGGDLAGGGNLTSNYINSIGSTTGCPKSAQVLYMGMAADCTYVAKYGSADNARTQLLTNLNTVSALYQRTFNISLGAVELQVVNGSCPSTASSSLPWNTGCPTGSSTTGSANALDLNSRLSAFSQWRGSKGGSDGAGLWHLLTDCNAGQEVGVAWLGTLCRVGTSTSSSGEVTSGTGVTSSTSREWQVMAHEIGHNFGAIHDCASGCTLSQACCPLSTTTCNANANYIMSPVSEQNTTTFSPCTIGNVCTALGTTLNTTCLYTPGNREVISLQQCGNGILEPGEECDPGAGNESSCCDSSTCKLRSGAQCDPATNTCCTNSCTFAPSTRVCRPAVNQECDIAETCTGNSADCPADETKPDGTSCGSNGLKCASGYCTSKDQQCANLGGSMGIRESCNNIGDRTCEVTCQNPSSALSCIILEGQSFIDGTECGYGGHCRNGECQSGSWQNTVASWFTDNKRISIPVTVVGGIIILLILFAILRCCFRKCAGGGGGRRRNNGKAASQRYSSSSNNRQNMMPPPPPPQPMMQNNYRQPSPNSYSSTQPFNTGNGYPQQPYPTYGGDMGNQGGYYHNNGGYR